MVTILAHVRVRPGAAPAFERIARDLYLATHSMETGVVRFEYWRGTEPDTYYALMSFADYLAFLEHQASRHQEGAGPALGTVVESMDLEWVDPLHEASPLERTAGQLLPPMASPAQRRFARHFPPEVASWWAALRDAERS